MRPFPSLFVSLALAAAPWAAQARAQDTTVVGVVVDTAALRAQLPPVPSPTYTFRSPADSLEWVRSRELAERAREFRVVVSLQDRELSVITSTNDTLLTAPVAVASGLTLDYAGRSWTFRTPRGRHEVLRKTANPEWTPPDWLYAEAASEYGLQLKRLPAEGVRLSDGRRLVVRYGAVGLVEPGSDTFVPLPTDEHIVFDNTLFIPPIGVANRKVPGELGHFALDMGDGYLLHGTPDKASIGNAVTHGCLRLADEDIAWLYEHVDVGTPVFIY
jgi:lipoprotein-anchoring transpeptidase ErfK/SrfK